MIDMTIYVDNIVTEGLHDDKKQRQIIKGILEYIQSKKYVFQVLLEKGGDFDLQHDILAFFGERIFQKVYFATPKCNKMQCKNVTPQRVIELLNSSLRNVQISSCLDQIQSDGCDEPDGQSMLL